MTLPSALAARLAKRGLINKTSTNNPEDKNGSGNINTSVSEVEEVIAEDYDDQENQGNLLNKLSTKLVDYDVEDFITSVYEEKKFLGYPGCPNKYNIYHECTIGCKELWKDGISEPDPKYLKRKTAMLLKYPLPSHWKEIYDPGTGRHYYWETDSDAVSWLPPTHPKAVISESAAALREQEHYKNNDVDMEKDENKSEGSEESSDESEDETTQIDEKQRKREALEKQRSRGRMKKLENDLDPMDPAAYSDIPRGGWSDGLVRGNEAKTGADVTAAGPLYQMRPYPNPGAVLRANSNKKPPPV
ncbi:polyglutamine-binding protein 1 [Nilaparvata lugens]|uniref:polyglutamine-binding protein 1 n=1 Tax=Nilaparvata lugens TaxID=108931 RepID=UPI00193D724E|nr:polyglutamine-binding protein 1 [Nilaparvata lugens]